MGVQKGKFRHVDEQIGAFMVLKQERKKATRVVTISSTCVCRLKTEENTGELMTDSDWIRPDAI